MPKKRRTPASDNTFTEHAVITGLVTAAFVTGAYISFSAGHVGLAFILAGCAIPATALMVFLIQEAWRLRKQNNSQDRSNS